MTENLPFVVTGAASGIGAWTCRELAAHGSKVIGVDRNPAVDFPGQFVRADLSTAHGVTGLIDQLPEELAGLINIAGVPGTAPAGIVLAVNVFGLRELTATLGQRIVAGGSVINLSSAVADNWRGDVEALKDVALTTDVDRAIAEAEQLLGQDSYRRSKEMVRFLTEYFSAEFIPRRVRVVSVSPGPVNTPILEDFKTDHGREKVESAAELLGRFGTPQDIARVVAFLLSPEAAWINGTDIRVDGGLNAWRAINS